LEAAWRAGADVLIEEAQRRGQEGWDEPVHGRLADGSSGVIGSVRRYSDNLLMFSIKGRRPEYKENPKIDLRAGVQVDFVDQTAPLAELVKFARSLGVLDASPQLRELPESIPAVIDVPAKSKEERRDVG
jgi:hypothetical protein